ncbi:mitochondrial protein [Coprinellus micaceus]|uniref:Mitochondrial protein n=1 Tax=Coprinellus micaceus TaxID=71717 RepID=A0A4Y7TQD7_COPMI|nr:mitochondrial protein [Coprinellus micaceus]
MNTVVKKILVVGGNGFIGSAVCRAALSKGIEVTSVSSSGRPYQTPKGHSPAWVAKVNWQKGDALTPQTFAHLLPEVCGVVHTLGTLLEDGAYKQAVRTGDFPGLLKSLAGVGKDSNPLRSGANAQQERGSYETLNRDSAVRVCEAFVNSSRDAGDAPNQPRPFVYLSAEDIFRPVIPAGYIESKREAERRIEEIVMQHPSYRGVYIRPSLVYHAHLRPLTTPIATLLDLSAAIHRKVPRTLPTPSSILRALGQTSTPASESGASSPLNSIANALTLPPIHVDQVAAAIFATLDSSAGIRGVVGVNRMRELIGWRTDDETRDSVPLGRSL